MKHLLHCFFVAAFALALPAMAGDLPEGFQEMGLIEKLRMGEVVSKVLQNEKLEYKVVMRAFIHKDGKLIEGKDFVNILTDYKSYPALFPQVKEAEAKATSDDKSTYEYRLKIEQGAIEIDVTGELKIALGKDANAETRIVNKSKVFEPIEPVQETVRLIPFEKGLLLEDTLYVKFKQKHVLADKIKKQLDAITETYIKTFRKKLEE